MTVSIDEAHFKMLLLKHQAELRDFSDIGDEAADTVELDQARLGRLSRMDALQSQAMSQETNRRRGVELKKIAAALVRLQEGEYGYCITCGEQIAIKRLEVDPAAPLCIDCANRSEQG